MFSADDCDAMPGGEAALWEGLPISGGRETLARGSCTSESHLTSSSLLSTATRLALFRGKGAARMTSEELGYCRRAPLCRKGKTLHSTLMGQPLPPQSAPRHQWLVRAFHIL